MIEEKLKDILEKTFTCEKLVVNNQSHLHAGHAGSPGTGQSHFEIIIVSNEFEGKTKLMRHRMVNQAVYPLFSQGLHALSINVYTPKEYNVSQ